MITNEIRAALLYVLWHHQGGSSDVGQPIRLMLGLGQHEHLSVRQVDEAQRVSIAPSTPAPEGPDCTICGDRGIYQTGTSGREDDGNAPEYEQCDCVAEKQAIEAELPKPEAWAVYWGFGGVSRHSVHFDKATADDVAREIKSFQTEVRPLYAALAAI